MQTHSSKQFRLEVLVTDNLREMVDPRIKVIPFESAELKTYLESVPLTEGVRMKVLSIQEVNQMETNFDIWENLIRFMESKARNEWLTLKTDRGIVFDVYVRKSKRIVPAIGEPKAGKRFFDIGSITVDYKHRREGAFKEFLFKLKSAAQDFKFDGIFVENILNPDLYAYLLTKEGFRGYGLESAYLIFTPEDTISLKDLK